MKLEEGSGSGREEVVEEIHRIFLPDSPYTLTCDSMIKSIYNIQNYMIMTSQYMAY